MKLPRRLGSIYRSIALTYRAKAGSLLLIAVVVFVPVGFLDALTTTAEVESIDFAGGVHVLAVVLATALITMSGLLGEVFYAGAVAVSLTLPQGEKPPPLLEVARHLNYKRLILVDIAYVLFVILGLVAFFIPGILIFVWFGLSGPVVEIENRPVIAALRRSASLVRGSFWVVFFVLAPVEILGDVVANLTEHAAHGLLGDSFFATWLAESAANVVFTPVFAVAAVLLTLDLIGRHADDGEGVTAAAAA